MPLNQKDRIMRSAGFKLNESTSKYGVCAAYRKHCHFELGWHLENAKDFP